MIKKRKLLQYQVVSNDLRSKIKSGELPLGCRIAPENELSSHYDTSLSTIRKAVQLLCNEGLLCKRRPVGTFVIGTPEVENALVETPAENIGKNLKIAVLLPNLTDVLPEGDYQHWQLHLRRLKGIFAAAAKHNANVLVHDLSDKPDLTAFDGVIIIRWFELFLEEPFNSIAEKLDNAKVPYVVISDYFSRLNCKWWVADNLQVEFFNAYKFLAGNGSKRILIIGPSMNDDNPRIIALKEAAANFDFSYELLENMQSDRQSALELLSKYDKNGEKLKAFDTIFCTTDLQALGVMDYALSNNISIPEDINVMGCDNLAEAASSEIPLTTFEFSTKSSGVLAFELLLEAIKTPEDNGKMVSGRGRIIIRDSVKLKQ